MRGSDERTGSLFSFVDLEERVPKRHPLRKIREIVNDALAALDGEFSTLYAAEGRPSIPRSFMSAALAHAQVKPLLSNDHFSVDGTLIEAWASLRSFRAKDGSDEPPSPGRNGERDFHGERRANDTHESTTDPDAKLYRKSSNTAAKLSYIGHALAENRHGLIVEADATKATSRAEREAALSMIERHDPGSERRLTLAADKAYDTKGFVAACRQMCVIPHVAAKLRHSAIDGRTTRHPAYAVSQRKRKLIEEAFGWA